MTEREFRKTCWDVFKSFGFIKHNTHFIYYGNESSDLGIVYSLQKSIYGAYYYIEHGYYIKSLNPKMPYPTAFASDVRCDRVRDNKNNSCFEYETIFEEKIVSSLKKSIEEMMRVLDGGKESLKNFYIKERSFSYIDPATMNYLGITKQ